MGDEGGLLLASTAERARVRHSYSVVNKHGVHGVCPRAPCPVCAAGVGGAGPLAGLTLPIRAGQACIATPSR